MKENQKKAFDFAADTTKQLITISTAIITLTVTFSKDILGDSIDSPKELLIATWAVFIVSIICGVLTLMTLTGTLQPMKKKTPVTENKEANSGSEVIDEDDCADININNKNIRIFSISQSLFFIAAIIMTGIFGYLSLGSGKQKNKDQYMFLRHSTFNNDSTKVYTDTLYIPKSK